MRVLAAVWRARRLPGFRRAVTSLLRDLTRDPTRDRLRRFGQGAVLAIELPPETNAIYAHFIHTPSSVARYASQMKGLDWMCSAHAKDIWTSADWELSDKLASAAWTVTCTEVGHQRLTRLASEPGRVRLMYHGLDFGRFAPFDRQCGARDGSDPSDPVEVLSVGRVVPKKGLDILIGALARLPRELSWRLTHVGGGTEQNDLSRQATEAGIADKIVWAGAQDQPGVLASYRRSDLFALACRVTASGDRDGLPNVLMEAQSQGLACLSTTVGAVPELITNGETGILVPPDDVGALAAALARLIRTPERRFALGQAGARRVRTKFDARLTLPQLLGLLAVDPLRGPEAATPTQGHSCAPSLVEAPAE